MIKDHSDHGGTSKKPLNLCPEWIQRLYDAHDPRDLGSLILIRIIPEECTLNFTVGTGIKVFSYQL